MIRPSFSISVPDAARVSPVSRSRSRIMSSTVRPPTIERRWPAKTLWTRWPIIACWSRKRRAALAIDTVSSPTLKITTPLTCTGIPCEVTHSTSRSASLRSSDSLRTTCTPGVTSVPRPVTTRNPNPSPTPSARCLEPEMISASLGSATRHMSLKSTIRMMSEATDAPAMPISIGCSPF